MKLWRKKKHSKKTSRLPVYLLLAVVATMLATTGTLAKYSSQFSASTVLNVAAFAGGGSFDFDLDEDLENMYPADTRTVYFAVQNYEDGQDCDVAMEYQVRLETTGNLPLNFTLRRKTDGGNEKGEAVGALEISAPAAGEEPIPGVTYVAAGGKLPVASADDGRTVHAYELEVSWPPEYNDMKYSGKVDEVTVTVIAEQVRPDGEE